jgi:hypothetical protein
LFRFILCLSLLALCAQCAPKFSAPEYPVQFQGVYYATFDKAWDGALKILHKMNAEIIVKDKQSSLIVCSVIDAQFNRPVYMNIYIDAYPADKQVVVYLFPMFRLHKKKLKETKLDVSEAIVIEEYTVGSWVKYHNANGKLDREFFQYLDAFLGKRT